MELLIVILVVSFSLSCAVLQRRPARRDGGAARLVKRTRLTPSLPLELREKLSAGKPFTHPASDFRRQRRSDDTCGLRKSAVLETDPVRQ